MQNKFIYTALISILMLGACNEGTQPTVESVDPVIEAVYLNYSWDNDYLYLAADVTDPQGDDNIFQVTFNLYFDKDSADNDSLIVTGNLLDDGLNGDIIVSDGCFTYLLNGPLAEGDYYMNVQAVDANNNTSEILSANTKISQNEPPVVYLLEMSESLEPSEGFGAKVRVSDPQGLSDIRAVYHVITDSDGNIISKRTMADLNGGTPFPDLTAGDGIYAISFDPMPVEPNMQGLFTFSFYVIDNSLVSSDTLKEDIIFYGVNITIPNDQDTTFTAGNTVRIEWDNAYIDELVIQYSDSHTGSGTAFTTLDTLNANLERYDWEIPSDINSDNCRIKLYDPDKPTRYDISDSNFSIKP